MYDLPSPYTTTNYSISLCHSMIGYFFVISIVCMNGKSITIFPCVQLIMKSRTVCFY
jgi:hypothetical protein